MQHTLCVFGTIFALVLLVYYDVSAIEKHQDPIQFQSIFKVLTENEVNMIQKKSEVSPPKDVVQSEIISAHSDRSLELNQETDDSRVNTSFRAILTFYLEDEEDIEKKEVIQRNKGW